MKVCAACCLEKENTEFSKNKTLKSGLNSSCKQCVNIRAKQQYKKHLSKRLEDKTIYRNKNRENLRLKAVEYRKEAWDVNKVWRTNNRDKIRLTAHRRRARIRDAKINSVTSKDIKQLLSKPCIYCGEKAEHVDHVVPLSRGGSHSLGNLAPSCQICNLRKNKKFVIEWKASKRDISMHINVQQHA